jgi:tetratricopeptide (TPR) repeat protein
LSAPPPFTLAAVSPIAAGPQPAMRLSLPAAPSIAPGQLDQWMARNVYDAVQAGQLNARNPGLRSDLMTLLSGTAFTPEGYRVFTTILQGCAGRDDAARIQLLEKWAAAERQTCDADLIAYYAAFHFREIGRQSESIRRCRGLADASRTLGDRALLLMALCQSQSGDNRAARLSLAELEQHFPDSPSAAEGLYMQAWLKLQDGAQTEATALLQKAISSYPDSPAASRARDALASLEGAP